MKNLAIVLAVLLAILTAAGVAISLRTRSQRPDVLLKKLAAGKGDRDMLITKLNLSRGDVTSALIEALNDRSHSSEFRAEVVELMHKRNHREQDPILAEALKGALSDPDAVVRQRAALCTATYGNDRMRLALIDLAADPDPDVRRQVYLSFGDSPMSGNPESGVWEELSPEHLDALLAGCRKTVASESDAEELRFLARAVIGRQIEILCRRAIRAQQSSQPAEAERLLNDAIALDETNHQAQIRLVKFLLKEGRREDALHVAREYGSLIEVPRLSAEPAIDGNPDDAVWDEAFVAEEFFMTGSRWAPRPAPTPSVARIAHRDGVLYISLVGYEPSMDEMRSSHQTRDSDVWRDDCMEFAFDPAVTDNEIYQFIVNPTGMLFDMHNGNKGENFECRYAAMTSRDGNWAGPTGKGDGDGYWAVEIAIRGEDLDGHAIEPGELWAMNVFRARNGAASEHAGLRAQFGTSLRKDLFPLALFLPEQSEE